jgi:hypothetical protein
MMKDNVQMLSLPYTTPKLFILTCDAYRLKFSSGTSASQAFMSTCIVYVYFTAVKLTLWMALNSVRGCEWLVTLRILCRTVSIVITHMDDA